MKKVNKNSLTLYLNSRTLWWLFGDQTAPSPWPYECNAQIICIAYLQDGSVNLLWKTPQRSLLNNSWQTLNNLISYKCFFSHLLIGTSLWFKATKCQFTLLMKTPHNLFKQFKTPSSTNEGHTFSLHTTKVAQLFFSHHKGRTNFLFTLNYLRP